VREEKRNPPKKESMENIINIQISCPVTIHNEIEELCINKGMTLSKYFLSLHENTKLDKKEHEEKGDKWEDDNELPATSTTGIPDKFYKKKTGKK
jgi:hypothetical protein